MTAGRVAPRRILIIRLSALGDVLLASPIAQILKVRFPSAEIDWLVESQYVPLLEGNSAIRPIPYFKRGVHAGSRGLVRLRSELSRGGYDLAIDLQGKPKTALLATVARERLTLRKRTFGQALLSLFGWDPPRIHRHATRMFVEVLRPLGVEGEIDGQSLRPSLTPTDEGRRETEALPESRRRAVGLALSAQWRSKCWVPERFGQLGTRLWEQGFQPILIVGPGDVVPLARAVGELPEECPVIETSRLSVAGLTAAIARCDAVVGGDSGPLHIAAALDKPVVALFGPTDPDRWRPLAPRVEVVRYPVTCSPCSNHGTATCPERHHDCMMKLEVAQVEQALSRVLP